jgi:SAM-dependent methyltransferase
MNHALPNRRSGPSSLMLQVYPEAAFGGFTRCDGTIPFLDRVRALLPERGNLLDIGCGRGQQSEDPCRFRRSLFDLREPGRHMFGIDVDPAAEGNPFLDEFRRIEDVLRWPIDDASIDLAISVSVLEHVPDPTAFFDEAARVLKPGGFLCLRTPNKRSYPSIAARIVPNRHHAAVVGKTQIGRKGEDVFPTVYRCNTAGALRRQCRRLGLAHAVYAIEGEPSYLQFSPLLYRLFAVLHPLTPPMFRTTLYLFAQKNAG